MVARVVLFLLLFASATTGLGVSVLFGALGAYYMAQGIAVLQHNGRNLQ